MPYIRPLPDHEPPLDEFDTQPVFYTPPVTPPPRRHWMETATDDYDARMRARNSRVAEQFSSYQHDQRTITELEWSDLDPDSQLALASRQPAGIRRRLASTLHALARLVDSGVA